MRVVLMDAVRAWDQRVEKSVWDLEIWMGIGGSHLEEERSSRGRSGRRRRCWRSRIGVAGQRVVGSWVYGYVA